MIEDHGTRAAFRKLLIEESKEIARRNGSALKESIQDYAHQAGVAKGLEKAASLLDEFFKQGNTR